MPDTYGRHVRGSGVSEAVNRDEHSNPPGTWSLCSASSRSLEVGALDIVGQKGEDL